jgi:hypothetical protein
MRSASRLAALGFADLEPDEDGAADVPRGRDQRRPREGAQQSQYLVIGASVQGPSARRG